MHYRTLTQARAHACTPLSQLPSPLAPSQRETTAFIAANQHHTTTAQHGHVQFKRARAVRCMLHTLPPTCDHVVARNDRAHFVQLLLLRICIRSGHRMPSAHAFGGLGFMAWGLGFGVSHHLEARRAMAGPLMLAVAEEHGVGAQKIGAKYFRRESSVINTNITDHHLRCNLHRRHAWSAA